VRRTLRKAILLFAAVRWSSQRTHHVQVSI